MTPWQKRNWRRLSVSSLADAEVFALSGHDVVCRSADGDCYVFDVDLLTLQREGSTVPLHEPAQENQERRQAA